MRARSRTCSRARPAASSPSPAAMRWKPPWQPMAQALRVIRSAEEQKAACQLKPTAPLALSSTERLHKKPFACLPTALRPSGPVQQWIFHQAEQELTTLPGLRYSSGHRKGRLKVLILRNGAHVLGNRHHEDAVLLAAVRHDVHRGAACPGCRSDKELIMGQAVCAWWGWSSSSTAEDRP